MLDAIVILFLLCGAVLGFKKGAIRSLVGLIGTVAIVIIAYYLKNPVAELCFKYLPFFDFKGAWEGLVTLNILLYESISYIIVFVFLASILNILIKASGIVEKILNATIILGIPSKIIGAALGFLEAVVFAFIVLFAMLQFNMTHNLVMDSSISTSIIDKTPFIGSMVNDTYKAIQDINKLEDKYKNDTNKDAYNGEILNIMLKYNVVSPEVAMKLVEEGKLKFNGAITIINSFKETEND